MDTTAPSARKNWDLLTTSYSRHIWPKVFNLTRVSKVGMRDSTLGTEPWSLLHSWRNILLQSVTTSGVMSTECCPDFAWTWSLRHPSLVRYPTYSQWFLLPLRGRSLNPRIIILKFKMKTSRFKVKTTTTRVNSGRAHSESCTSFSPRVGRRLRSRHLSKGLKTCTCQ